jgi:hypothetical protein
VWALSERDGQPWTCVVGRKGVKGGKKGMPQSPAQSVLVGFVCTQVEDAVYLLTCVRVCVIARVWRSALGLGLH